MAEPGALPTVDLRFGDCLAVLRELPDESVHAVITDPPYGLADHKPERIAQAVAAWVDDDREHVPDGVGFMGRAWDAFVPPPAVWDECLRVLKPGGHLLAFAGSRTADLMGLSVRMAGFEIRDTIMWVYGSGFPKGRRISADIDRQLGSPRGRVELVGGGLNSGTANGWNGSDPHSPNAPLAGTRADDEARTPEASRWEGWNTSLKPAQEPIIVARKPFPGTVASNTLAHGTGGINVDACRVGTTVETWPSSRGPNQGTAMSGGVMAKRETGEAPAGRWPANVVLTHAFAEGCEEACADGCPVAELDRQSGTSKSSANPNRFDGTTVTVGNAGGRSLGGFVRDRPAAVYGDEGGASRFFATFHHDDEIERDENGCVPGCPVAELDRQSGTLRSGGRPGARYDHDREDRAEWRMPSGVHHADEGGASRYFPTFRYQAKAPASERPKIDGKGWPTVKPQGLMKWLVRLVTPPGGLVLDPFAGTGSTLQAARDEGFASIGIERDEFAYRLAQQRLGLPGVDDRDLSA